MSIASRLRRFAPLAVLLTVTSLLAACSADVTGPSAQKRSGYITTSASIAPVSSASDTTKSGADSPPSTPVKTPTSSKPGKGDKTLSSGYNVPAL